ncbi:hypothetical protein [Pseudacidovorax intermedius]|uniref:hypothetical protein n=1 Tax=Pseudacidovorax intermedius TaxID=433924 RepID=UPI0026F1D719|nr:hypothetical protein [Pseudacidovorax intermedius]
MKKPAALGWWREGWNWIDRLFFYVIAVVAVSALTGYVMRDAVPSQWRADVWSAIAAWVQAIGSIAAIAAGVFTVRYQLSEQRREASERADEVERVAKSRGYQVLASSLYTCTELVGKLEGVIGDNRFSPHPALHVALEIERILREENAKSLTPAALAMLGEMVARAISVRAAIETTRSLDRQHYEKVMPALIKAVELLKSLIAIASRWVSSELASILSQAERDELTRAANA